MLNILSLHITISVATQTHLRIGNFIVFSVRGAHFAICVIKLLKIIVPMLNILLLHITISVATQTHLKVLYLVSRVLNIIFDCTLFLQKNKKILYK